MCLWTPCRSTRTFGRVADLERHYSDQHVRSRAYRCTALVYSKPCGKVCYRPDKLNHHLKTEHLQETEFSCPIPLCNAGPYTLELLCIHVFSHDKGTIKSSLGPASSCYFFTGYPSPCPVEDCGEKVKDPRDFPRHLRSHDTNTRDNNREAIRGVGYSEMTGLPLCPICRDSIDTDKEGELIVFEGTGEKEYFYPIGLHMFRCHWDEPEMLHKHRRDILKLDPIPFVFRDLIKNKVFKDVLATKNAEE